MSKKTTTNTIETVNNAVVDNATKVNEIVNFESLLNELSIATCKCDLVNTMSNFGFKCATAPTTTANVNDLYLQFRANKCGDVSRLQICKKTLKVYATETVMNELMKVDNSFIFDGVNDGSVRKHRLTVPRTIENFTAIFNYFLTSGIIENK